MVAFARFVMRDNGLAIHINAQQVTQVRQTSEGEPAIYTLGRDTPMVVEGTLEAVIRKLEAVAAGIRIVEPAGEPAADVLVESPAPTARPPALELVPASPAPEVGAPVSKAPEHQPEGAKAKPAKLGGRAKVKPAKAPAAVKAATAPAKVKAAAAKSTKAKSARAAKVEVAAVPQEPPYPAASWFRGNR